MLSWLVSRWIVLGLGLGPLLRLELTCIRFHHDYPSVLVTFTESRSRGVLENRWTGAVEEVSFTVLNSQNRARYTFAPGGSAAPPVGTKSGTSRRATPIRLSAIP